jgi:hypothetical protein
MGPILTRVPRSPKLIDATFPTVNLDANQTRETPAVLLNSEFSGPQCSKLYLYRIQRDGHRGDDLEDPDDTLEPLLHRAANGRHPTRGRRSARSSRRAAEQLRLREGRQRVQWGVWIWSAARKAPEPALDQAERDRAWHAGRSSGEKRCVASVGRVASAGGLVACRWSCVFHGDTATTERGPPGRPRRGVAHRGWPHAPLARRHELGGS